jgi:TonB family protein
MARVPLPPIHSGTPTRRALSALALAVAAFFLLLPIHDQAQRSTPQLMTPFDLTLEVTSDMGQSNLESFVEHTYKAVREKALDTLPKSVARGEQGIVTVQLKLQKDGKLTVAPAILDSTGNQSFERHAIASIRGAVPFDHLPPSTLVPLVLRFTFYYNMPHSRPHPQ